MIVYQNVFLGFPLPTQFHEELRNIKLKIKLTAPHFKPASSHNPHITGIFLGEIEESKFSEIISIVENEKSLPQGTTVTVTSLGYFTPTRPRVVYLGLDYPLKFQRYIETLEAKLLPFVQKRDSDQTFAPHLTLGRNSTRNTKKWFASYIPELEQTIQPVRWHMPLREIVLYGRNPFSQQKEQEIIAEIPLPLKNADR